MNTEQTSKNIFTYTEELNQRSKFNFWKFLILYDRF